MAKISQSLRDLTAAQSALVRTFDGDSNDAEHDAAVKLAESAGVLIQDPLHRAAPDLLAALKACDSALAILGQNYDDSGARCQARAAIAKADGEAR